LYVTYNLLQIIATIALSYIYTISHFNTICFGHNYPSSWRNSYFDTETRIVICAQ